MAGRLDNRDPTMINPKHELHKPRFWHGQVPGWFIVAIIPVIFLILFYILPVYEIFHKSLSGMVVQESSSQIWSIVSKSLGFTVWQALLSTILTLMLGLPAAYVLYKVQFRGRSIIRTITAIPFILPTVVVAAGINAFIGPRGWINLLLQEFLNLSAPPIHIMGTLSAILIAHVFYNLTIVIRLVGSAWSGLNPRLEAAANTLGANPFKTFWFITLPLLNPVITAAVILVFLFDFTSFGVILLLGGPGFATLEVEVFTQAMALFNLPLASILAFIQLICTLILTLVYQYFSSRPIPLVPATEKANSTRPANMGQKVLTATIVIILLLLILTPLVSLVARSFIRVDADRGERVGITSGFTLDYYQALSINPRQDYFYISPVSAIWNSVKFGIITSFLSLILGLMIVYGFKRNKNHSGVFDTLLMIPLGTSAVTLGLGYIIFFNKPPFLWGASQWLIPMAHTLVALPFVVKGLIPAVGSIPVSYRQSAAILGASPWKVIRSIDLPIIRSALISSMVFSFTISLGEFGATSFLSRPDFPTIPIAIFRFLSQPGGLNYGQAMAMSTILMLVCAIGIVFIEKTIFTVPETVN
jgi:thiamine transport system permease protein